ncbi:MAG: hypothetical protein WC750_06155 [Patescibacteria group bacterium]
MFLRKQVVLDEWMVKYFNKNRRMSFSLISRMLFYGFILNSRGPVEAVRGYAHGTISKKEFARAVSDYSFRARVILEEAKKI